MYADRSQKEERFGAAAGALLIQAMIAYALITGLRVDMPAHVREVLTLIAIAPPPPPPPPDPIVPRPRPSPRPEGAASPPNIRSRATEVVAPRPIPPPVPPPPIIAAPKPGIGADPTAGNADIRGPGTGSGGEGNGTGSGGSGTGSGGGGGTELRLIRGRIRDSDYPRRAFEMGASGTVYLRFVVGINGRVTQCTVTRSSGNRDLDETTCRLIMERFRYEPSRDARGRPYPDVVIGEHEWFLTDDPGYRERD